MDEHKISIGVLFKRLNSSVKGISTQESKKRREKFGKNILTAKNKLSPVFKFFSQFKNFFAILLIVGSILAFIAEYVSPGQGNLYIGIALFVVVIINSIFSFIQEYQSEKIMESFKKMLPNKAIILRDGQKIEVDALEIVPGDIIYLSEGDKIPADGRLIEHYDMKVNNSSITGESEPQLRKLECTHKNILESRNMVFSGTTVQSGNGIAVVYSTGMNTEIGKIIKLTKETKKTTSPLGLELKHFIKVVSSIAIILGILFFIASILIGHSMTGSLIFAIGIIVANVPEGLLPTVTLSLSMSAKRMAKKKALIKNLESVETLGSTTVICTDKTGTLTENNMAVETLIFDRKEKNVLDRDISKSPTFNYLIKAFVLCNNSYEREEKYVGDPTETSILNFASKYVNIQKLRTSEKRVHESPFDSITKRMITTNLNKGIMYAFMKGAPEVVIRKCTKIMLNGKVTRLSPKLRKVLLQEHEMLASRGERVLAYAFKKTSTEKVKEKDFTFIGISGMVDPLREGITSAIAKCKDAGIRVIMITGDHSLTAEAIARKAGIISHKKDLIILGEDIDRMSDKKLMENVEKENIVFARTSPSQKLRIVRCLQSLGEVVTVTGDGVNDAPALKNADMGVAMGLSGTEVAREASNMVLMDDHFATIVNAVEEGRTIYSNIKKFIAYILTSNIPEILPFIVFVLLKSPLALTVVLILAIDLGTDLLPAIGLGVEPAESDVMKEKPRSRKEKLMSWNLLFMSYGVVGVIQALAGFFSFYFILYTGGWQWGQQLLWDNPLYIKAITAFFASVIICQIANVIICRTRKQSVFKRGLFSNKTILLGIFVEIVLLLVIVYAPFANTIFHTAPLTLFELSLSLPFAFILFFGDEYRKYLLRKGNKFVEKYINW